MKIAQLQKRIRQCGQCYRVVAVRSGVSRSTIEKIGNGQHVNPNIDTFAMIANGLSKIEKER